MLRLSRSIFQKTYSFTSPKDAFAHKRVCKSFLDECSHPDFWKAIKDVYYADLPECDDYETALRTITELNSCFSFTLSLIRDGEPPVICHWKGTRVSLEKVMGSDESWKYLKKEIKKGYRGNWSYEITLLVTFKGKTRKVNDFQMLYMNEANPFFESHCGPTTFPGNWLAGRSPESDLDIPPSLDFRFWIFDSEEHHDQEQEEEDYDPHETARWSSWGRHDFFKIAEGGTELLKERIKGWHRF